MCIQLASAPFVLTTTLDSATTGLGLCWVLAPLDGRAPAIGAERQRGLAPGHALRGPERPPLRETSHAGERAHSVTKQR